MIAFMSKSYDIEMLYIYKINLSYLVIIINCNEFHIM